MQHASSVRPFSGEATCARCANRAYYSVGKAKAVFCGRHAPADLRTKLLQRPREQREAAMAARMAQHALTVERARHTDGTPGTVTLQRLRMMHTPELVPGKAMVFPNNRHGSHPMACFNCCELSPMRLGPVEHGQPGLPPSKNVENFHQGTKVFRQETDKNRNPTEKYYKNRLAAYQDPVAHRHKFQGTDQANKNIPLYFIWVDKEGTEHRLTYVQSRQFYCTFYERLASARPEYARLREMLASGTSLEICGYDAFPFDPVADAERAYLDSTKPFGHERVLAVMLSLPPEQYPWRKHKTFVF
eukprot:m51a1_g2345 hypothetical protein (302) ;mRNA; f:570478-571383